MKTTAWAVKTRIGFVKADNLEYWQMPMPLLFRTRKLALEYLRTHINYGNGVPKKVTFEIKETIDWRAT